MIKQKLIQQVLSQGGVKKPGQSWYALGIIAGVKSQDPERAKEDKAYEKKSIARRAQQIWDQYDKQSDALELKKQILVDGKIKFETFVKPAELAHEYDPEDYDIEKVTTNPHGGAWVKMKKKEKMYDDSHLETLKDMLTDNIEPIKIKKVKVAKEKALFVYGSDKHIGALTKENSIYTNQYDKKVMIERLVTSMLNEMNEQYDLHGHFDCIYVMDLGDALDGFNGKTTGGLRGTSSHTLPQQYNNREQHDLYVELHRMLFDSLVDMDITNDIKFIATSNSNHGGDFEYGAMRNLETYLNVKYPEIATFVNDKPFNHFFYGEHAIIFGHGKDDEDMKHGLPLVLNDKVQNYLNDYINQNELQNCYVTVVTGDLHQHAETHGRGFRYLKVLSQYGSSKWIHTNFGSGASGCTYEVFEKNTHKIHKLNVFNASDEPSTGIAI